MSHILITSTGRAGTSFLVQLLSELGLDTGYTSAKDCRRNLNATAHAGLEYHGRRPAPYIVKSTHLGGILGPAGWFAKMYFSHVFLCVRDLEQTAASRARCHDARPEGKAPESVPGGLVGAQVPGEQKGILLHRQWDLLLLVACLGCPVTIIEFPHMTRDPVHLYGKLREGLQYIGAMREYESFRKAFQKTVEPEWVHNTKENRT